MFLPPLSASTYAARHGVCANNLLAQGKTAWMHRTVQVFEYIPVVGILVALIERVVAFICHCFTSNKQEKDLTSPPSDSLKTDRKIVPTQEAFLISSPDKVVENALSFSVSLKPNAPLPPSTAIPIEKDLKTDKDPSDQQTPNTGEQKLGKDEKGLNPSAATLDEHSQSAATLSGVSPEPVETISEEPPKHSKDTKEEGEIKDWISISSLKEQQLKLKQSEISRLEKKQVRIQESVKNYTTKVDELKQDITKHEDIINAINLEIEKMSTGTYEELKASISYQPDDLIHLENGKTIKASNFIGNQTQTLKLERDFEIISEDQSDQFKSTLSQIEKRIPTYKPTLKAILKGESYSFLGPIEFGLEITYKFAMHFTANGVLPSVNIYWVIPVKDLYISEINGEKTSSLRLT